MELYKELSGLVIGSVSVGGLLAFVAWVIGSVVHILINVMKKG